MNIETLLKNRGVDFDILPHRAEYTARQTAGSVHIPQSHFAKTVVVTADGRPVLVVVPANRYVNLKLVRRELGARHVRLTDEHDLHALFPDCELGAVPPFGSAYYMQTLVDDELSFDDHIVFDSNSHESAVYMRFQDYEELEHPRLAHLTE